MLPQLQTALATLTISLTFLSSQLSTTITYTAAPVYAKAPESLPQSSRILTIPEKIDAATKAAGIPQPDREKLKLIAYCESKYRQFDSDGSVLSGLVHAADKGLFQINTEVHHVSYETVEQNISAALSLYAKRKLQPWYSSFPCWSKLSTTTDDIIMDSV